MRSFWVGCLFVTSLPLWAAGSAHGQLYGGAVTAQSPVTGRATPMPPAPMTPLPQTPAGYWWHYEWAYAWSGGGGLGFGLNNPTPGIYIPQGSTYPLSEDDSQNRRWRSDEIDEKVLKAAARSVKNKGTKKRGEIRTDVTKLIELGDQQFSDQKHAAALDSYQSAARIDPTSADAQLRQGFVLSALGRYDQAVKVFRRALQLRQDWTESSFELNQICSHDGLAATERRMSRALEIKPRHLNLLIAMSMQMVFNGLPDQARAYVDRAIDIAGENDPMLAELVKLSSANAPPKPGRIAF
jgi:tetratricopeptide (TPR) repeat protein